MADLTQQHELRAVIEIGRAVSAPNPAVAHEPLVIALLAELAAKV